jgi:Kef-type K+ transport system membrane component KefB
VRIRSVVQIALVSAAVVLLVAGFAISDRATGQLDEFGRLALALAIVVAAALFGGHGAARIGLPVVVGELVAGVVLGNMPGLTVLRFVGTDPYLDILARIGMLLLLFEVGLGLSVRDLFTIGPSALLVAVIGTVASMTIGMGAATALMPSAPTIAIVFLGAAITATSVGITARVLKDMGASRSREATIILGAAVVDDVLALVVLGGVTAWARHSTGLAGVAPVLALVMKSTGFLVLAVVLGARLTPRWFREAGRLQTRGALLAVGLCFCFALSWAASAIGLAALVGAFAAGLVLEDTHSAIFVQRGEPSLSELLQPMVSFLVPVFFFLVGFRTNLATLFSHPAFLLIPVALTIAAVLGKLSCAAGVLARGVNKLTVALGMIPRGEVTLVFATFGSTLRIGDAPLLDERGYAALVTVVIATTLVTPPALKWSLGSRTPARGLTTPAA